MESAVVVLVFIYESGVRPDLHSVPTRRSSDLLLSIRREAIVNNALASDGVDSVRLLSGQRRCTCRSQSKTLGLSVDRKSTRLNSSHSQISYAVFCLKKKITSR